MTGRIAAVWNMNAVLARFAARTLNSDGGLHAPSWNIGPRTADDRDPVKINVVVQSKTGENYLRAARWKFEPTDDHDVSGGPLPQPMINVSAAKGGKELRRSTYANQLDSRRCIVPVTGYYVWRGAHPYYVYNPSRTIWLAGLYSAPKQQDSGHQFLTVTLITTDAVGKLYRLQDEMPLIVPDDLADSWLSRADLGGESREIIGRVVDSAESEARELHFHEVDPIHGDGERLTAPIGPEADNAREGGPRAEGAPYNGIDFHEWRIDEIPSPRELDQIRNSPEELAKRGVSTNGPWKAELVKRWRTARIGEPAVHAPSPEEIASTASYTAEQVAQWGVSWPLTSGWKDALIAQWKRQHPEW